MGYGREIAMGWYFAILFFVVYIFSLILIAELEEECGYWESEAKKWCAELGEINIKEYCNICPDEDTDKCKTCDKG